MGDGEIIRCIYTSIFCICLLESMAQINTELLSVSLKEIAMYVSRALEEKRLLYFGMANLDFKFSDPVFAFMFLDFL